MIGNVVIENFKSITKLELELGRINVLIGANGCGKSNILEAIALFGAAAADKLDNEFLASRGIRIPDEPDLLSPAFGSVDQRVDTKITINSVDDAGAALPSFTKQIYSEATGPYVFLRDRHDTVDATEAVRAQLFAILDRIETADPSQLARVAKEQALDVGDITTSLKDYITNLGVELKVNLRHSNYPDVRNFVVFAPEFHTLRNFVEEGQVVPLGSRGEGLFKLLTGMSSSDKLDEIGRLKEQLRLIDWFEDFDFAPTAAFGDRSLRIKDKYFDPSLPEMSQRSSNEGFLFLLFYFCLFISDLTPKFFAVDNIDASLNPKLCARLMVQLTELAKKHDKQAIFTTHNPAVLDGLNLDDDEQRLFVVYRNGDGHTTVKRVIKPQPLPGQKPVKLSEAFMRGYIGGLPDNF